MSLCHLGRHPSWDWPQASRGCHHFVFGDMSHFGPVVVGLASLSDALPVSGVMSAVKDTRCWNTGGGTSFSASCSSDGS